MTRKPTLKEAIRSRLAERGFPMGPDEAASIAVDVVQEYEAGTLPICACGSYVALCQHRQPWSPAVIREPR